MLDLPPTLQFAQPAPLTSLTPPEAEPVLLVPTVLTVPQLLEIALPVLMVLVSRVEIVLPVPLPSSPTLLLLFVLPVTPAARPVVVDSPQIVSPATLTSVLPMEFVQLVLVEPPLTVS